VVDVVLRVRGLDALQLGVPRQHAEPRLRRVAVDGEGHAGVAREQPPSLLVVGDHVHGEVRAPGEDARRQAGFERLHRAARLEEEDVVRRLDAPRRRPRPLLHELDRQRLDV
jgi:hypothetical protein